MVISPVYVFVYMSEMNNICDIFSRICSPFSSLDVFSKHENHELIQLYIFIVLFYGKNTYLRSFQAAFTVIWL